MAKKSPDYYERRGSMVYIEASSRKPAKYLAECRTPEEAVAIVAQLNTLTDAVVQLAELRAIEQKRIKDEAQAKENDLFGGNGTRLR